MSYDFISLDILERRGYTMIKKGLILTSTIIMIFLISGCALSDYLTGNVPVDTAASEDDLMEENSINEIDELLREIEEDSRSSEMTEEDSREGTGSSEMTEEDILEEVDESSFIKISVKEDELVKLKPKAKDADGDTITYSFSEPLDRNGEWKTNYGDAGNYLVVVTASDGTASTTKKVLLTVERVNVAPIISNIPSTIVVDEGETISLEPTVEDPNGDKVSLSISDPVGDDGVWKVDYQTYGEYEVRIIATDGELDTIKTIAITVNKKNVAPKIEKIGDVTIQEGEGIEIIPQISDVNGDDVIVTISEPIGDDGIWDTAFTDHGIYTITITADDGTTTSTITFELEVEDINVAPEIITIEQG